MRNPDHRTRRLAAMATLVAVTAPIAAQYPDGPGKEILEKQCSTCHSLEIVVDKRHDAAEWKAVVMEMIDRGAEVSEEQVPVIVEYLATNWNKPSDKPADKPAAQSTLVKPVAAH